MKYTSETKEELKALCDDLMFTLDYVSLFKKYLSFVFIVAEGQSAVIDKIEQTVSAIPNEILPQSPLDKKLYDVVDWLWKQDYFSCYCDGDLLEECHRAAFFANKDYETFKNLGIYKNVNSVKNNINGVSR